MLLTAWLVRQVERQGRPTSAEWRRPFVSAVTWVGIVLIVGAFNATAAGFLVVVLLVLILVYVVLTVARGVRNVPELVRQMRRIGEPDAWRGR